MTLHRILFESGVTLELGGDGYEREEGCWHDRNWISLTVVTRSMAGEMAMTAPVLTSEVADLAAMLGTAATASEAVEWIAIEQWLKVGVSGEGLSGHTLRMTMDLWPVHGSRSVIVIETQMLGREMAEFAALVERVSAEYPARD